MLRPGFEAKATEELQLLSIQYYPLLTSQAMIIAHSPHWPPLDVLCLPQSQIFSEQTVL